MMLIKFNIHRLDGNMLVDLSVECDESQLEAARKALESAYQEARRTLSHGVPRVPQRDTKTY
jgi:hypothetical protein